jgi:hypothetical protein
MKRYQRLVLVGLGLLNFATFRLQSQTAPAGKPEPDVVIFVDGEKLIGTLQSSTGSSVTFKSDVAGLVTVDWSKVQELRSPREFAAVPKNVTISKSMANSVPQGTISVADKNVHIQPSGRAPQTIPVTNVANLVEESAYRKAFSEGNFLEGWKGGATAGLSVTQATQKNQSFTSAVNLIRTAPDVDWLQVSSRTIFNYNQAYSKVTNSGLPSIKTSLYHFDAEQDWYLSPRLFAFVSGAWDHSFSQGLVLQQSYGVGIGFVLIKDALQELDFKASMNYVNQRFQNSNFNKSLVGTVFGETYVRKFVHGILLNEAAGITPTWNDTSAWSAFASAALTFPVYHNFGFTIGTIDNYLNSPLPGFQRNSFQLTLGATYSFQ